MNYDVQTKIEKWISKKLNLDYILFGFCFKIKYVKMYYDGWHKCIYLGFFYISWGSY